MPPPKPQPAAVAVPPPASITPEPGLSLREILDRMDRMDDRSSAERRAQAEAFSARIEDEANHAQAAAQALVAALGERVTELGMTIDKRIGDLLAEQASARRENRWLMMLMVVLIGGLSGLNLWVKADGSVGVSQPTAVTDPGADGE